MSVEGVAQNPSSKGHQDVSWAAVGLQETEHDFVKMYPTIKLISTKNSADNWNQSWHPDRSLVWKLLLREEDFNVKLDLNVQSEVTIIPFVCLFQSVQQVALWSNSKR